MLSVLTTCNPAPTPASKVAMGLFPPSGVPSRDRLQQEPWWTGLKNRPTFVVTGFLEFVL
jgi:hypothetical protein